MELANEQIDTLLKLTAATREQTPIGCDDCARMMDQFIQTELEGLEIPAALQAVKIHLTQCNCCLDEHDAIMTALTSMDQPDQ